MNAPTLRPIDVCLAGYACQHRTTVNQAIHMVAVPAMLWAVVALLWCIPVQASWFRNGMWAGVAMFFAWAYYNRLSRNIGYGMFVVFFTIGCSCRLVLLRAGLEVLLQSAVAVLVIAWLALAVGNSIENRQLRFFINIKQLPAAPIWVLAAFYRKMGWRY